MLLDTYIFFLYFLYLSQEISSPAIRKLKRSLELLEASE